MFACLSLVQPAQELEAKLKSQETDEEEVQDSSDSSSSSESTSEERFGGFGSIVRSEGKSKARPIPKKKQSSSAARKRRPGADPVASTSRPKAAKKPKTEIIYKDALEGLKFLTATNLHIPGNGSRERDVNAKLNKANQALDALSDQPSDDNSAGQKDELVQELNRVNFFRNVLQAAALEAPILNAVTLEEVKNYLHDAPKDDIATIVAYLHEFALMLLLIIRVVRLMTHE